MQSSEKLDSDTEEMLFVKQLLQKGGEEENIRINQMEKEKPEKESWNYKKN